MNDKLTLKEAIAERIHESGIIALLDSAIVLSVFLVGLSAFIVAISYLVQVFTS